MKANIYLAVFSIMFLNCSISLWCYEDKSSEKTQKKVEDKRLVRIDLLKLKKKELMPPKRNIFSMKRETYADLESSSISAEERNIMGQGLDIHKGQENSLTGLDLNYIGYVESEEKIIALIIFRGEALAVQKGDVISENIVIGEVTKDGVEIIVQGSRKKTFSLEEEKP